MTRSGDAPTERVAAPLGAPIDWRRCAVLALVGTVASLVVVLAAVLSTPEPPPGATEGGYTSTYTPPGGRFEVLLDHADGQAYASLAQDPSWSHPEVFVAGGEGAGPFLPRPVLPVLLWAGSLGQPDLVPVAYVILESLAGGLLVGAVAALLHASGRAAGDRLALVVLALPGTLIGLAWLAPDVLALGLALAGVVAWYRPRCPAPVAAAVLVAAGLTRETMLVAVAVIAVEGIHRRGVRPSDALLVLAPVAYGIWSLVVASRFDAPRGKGLGYNLAPPLTGIVEAAPGWGTAGAVLVASQLALVGVGLWHRRDRFVTWLLVGYALAATLTAPRVWWRWESGVRVILPLTVLALLDVRLPRVLDEALARAVPRGAPADLAADGGLPSDAGDR